MHKLVLSVRKRLNGEALNPEIKDECARDSFFDMALLHDSGNFPTIMNFSQRQWYSFLLL
jgi:hypothetical protein